MSLKEIVVKAATIEGWMSEDELRWLAETAVSRQTIIEVGSWKGRSTKALALSTPGVVFAVDHWLGSESEREGAHKEALDLGGDKFFSIFQENLRSEILCGKVIPIRSDSAVAVELLRKLLMGRGTLADMVFIDAEHTYESVRRDIQTYASLLGSKGMMCGHDYSTAFPGIMKAVEESFSSWRMGGGSIWTSIKP